MEAVVHYSKLSCSSSEMDLGRFKTLRETVNELFFDFGYARIAAISGWMPMMFITPGQIVGEHVQRHLGGDLGQTLHQEVRRPPASSACQRDVRPSRDAGASPAGSCRGASAQPPVNARAPSG